MKSGFWLPSFNESELFVFQNLEHIPLLKFIINLFNDSEKEFWWNAEKWAIV